MNSRVRMVAKLLVLLGVITIFASLAIVGIVIQSDDPDSRPVAKAPTPKLNDPSRYWYFPVAGAVMLGWVAFDHFRRKRGERRYLAEAAQHRLTIEVEPGDMRHLDDSRWREKLVNQ